jgi:hypothetical protein
VWGGDEWDRTVDLRNAIIALSVAEACDFVPASVGESSRTIFLLAGYSLPVPDYQLSLVDAFDKFGRVEYRTFADDETAMQYAEALIGDWERVTVMETARIVGVVVHPRSRPRDAATDA